MEKEKNQLINEVNKFKNLENKQYEVGDRIRINGRVGEKFQRIYCGEIIEIEIFDSELTYVLNLDEYYGKYLAYWFNVDGYPVYCPCCRKLEIIKGKHISKEELIEGYQNNA